MSDEAHDTPVAATKSLFGALAFIFLLLGAEMIAEKDGTRWILGGVLVGCGIGCTYAAVFWNYVRTKLPKGAAVEINAIATSPRWWLGLTLLVLTALIFMPVIERPRWPSWPRTELSTVPTLLRLQFNAKGSEPQDINRQNIEWTFAMPVEKRLTGKKEKKICEPQALLFTPGAAPPRCESVEIPEYTDVPNWIVFLSFPTTIAAREIRINAHGATLPNWEVNSLSDHGAYVYFHGDLIRMVIDFQVVN